MGVKLGCSPYARNTNWGVGRYMNMTFNSLAESAATPVLLPTPAGQGSGREQVGTLRIRYKELPRL